MKIWECIKYFSSIGWKLCERKDSFSKSWNDENCIYLEFVRRKRRMLLAGYRNMGSNSSYGECMYTVLEVRRNREWNVVTGLKSIEEYPWKDSWIDGEFHLSEEQLIRIEKYYESRKKSQDK